MTREEAVAIAERARAQFGVPPHYSLRSAEKAIVELVEGETIRIEDHLPEPGNRYDLVAWNVTFGAGGSNVKLTVDDATARIVRVRRSR
jgi:hypothetical protein